MAGIAALDGGPKANALPTGGTVAAGAASISTAKNALSIHQSSQNAVINWQSFNIGAGQAVTFAQPNSNSVALNRVLGADPSAILGVLSANGKIFLLNPNGVLFAKGSQVNVAGLVASTLGITDAQFMAGNYKFSGSSSATIVNQGAIAAKGGYVALLGAQVDNEGVITARLGTVALAAGSALTLDVAGDGLLSVTIDKAAVAALAKNGGLVQADGGQVVLTAATAGQLLRTAVNNTGIIEAGSVEAHNGTIKLLGNVNSGGVEVAGTLNASGTAAGQTGGNVVVTGSAVTLAGTARIDVSGDAGGGSALIGGGAKGLNAAIPHARSVTMGKGAVIAADAISAGDGGQVVLWSTGTTQALGNITARGGARSGNGGHVETSGQHVATAATTAINTLAPRGTTGDWLLDPVNYTIAIVGGDETPASVAISLATSNRLITATNDITVANPVTWSTPQTLTLDAGNDVIVNGAITSSTAGAGLIVNAGHDAMINAALTSSGLGNLIQLNTGNNVNINAAVTASASGALVEFNSGHDINLNGAVTASAGGAVVFKADENGIPGPAGGTVNLSSVFPVTSTSKTIFYSPPGGYGAPTAYVGFISHMWVFVAANDKVYDGTTAATSRFYGDPTVGGTIDVNLVPGTIAFVDKNVGIAKPVNFSGFSINGAGAAAYALFAASGITTAAITPAPLTVTADGASKTYGQTAIFAPTAFTASGLVGGDTIASVTETSPGLVATAGVAGGPYAITPSNALGGSYMAGNYTTTYVPGLLTVTPAPLSITADDQSKLYGQMVVFAPTAFTSVGLLNGDTIAAVTEASPGAAATASVAGSPYAITPSNAVGGSYVASNYTTIYIPGVLTVNPAPLTVTADNLAKLYGQTATFAPTAFTSAGLLNGDTIAAVTETSPGAAPTASVAGGAYAITPSGAVGGSYVGANYITTYVPGSLSVTPAPLTVTADSTSKTYGQGVTFAPTAFVAVGLQNGDVIASVSETSAGATPAAPVVGSPYAITASNAVGGSYVPSNYTTAYNSGALVVTPASLVVKADDATKTDGQAVTFAANAFTATGLQNGDTIAAVTETSPGAAASASLANSPFTITASNAVGGTYVASNYTTTYDSGTLTSVAAVTPPTVTPPTVTPPVVTPPGVTPPVVTPPAVTPPTVTPPAVTPPGVTPPVGTPVGMPPVVTPPLGGTPGGTGPGGAGPGTGSPAAPMPIVTLATTTPEDVTGAAATSTEVISAAVASPAANSLVLTSLETNLLATNAGAVTVTGGMAGLSFAVVNHGVRMPSYTPAGFDKPTPAEGATAARQPVMPIEQARKPDRN